MSKTFKITLSLIGLSLTYLSVCYFFQSCQSKDKASTDDIAMVDDLSPGEEEIIDVSDEDFFEEDNSGANSDLASESFEELEDKLVEKPNTQSSVSNNNSRPGSSASYSSGNYMLISGNYLVKSNADEMVNKLKNLGYSGAEVVIFDRSQYHTVVASRFNSYETALQSASMLKQKGVDCYVKKKS